MPRILVIGSANADYTVAVARLPEPGETVSNGTLLVSHGGKGANQAVAARRLGADVRFIACVGDDAAGRSIREALTAEGIGVGGVSATPAAATGTALIVVDARGRNQIAVAPGANRLLSADLVRARADDFAWAEVLVCQLETPLPTVRWALEQARARRLVTILNPAPIPDGPLDCWPLIDYLTPNEGEAGRLSGMATAGSEGAVRAAGALRERGVGAVIITRGADGAVACTADGVQRVPAVSVQAVDTTAAGDAFTGALAVALAERRRVADAVIFANAAAALACTRRGAQPSLPTRADVGRLLDERD